LLYARLRTTTTEPNNTKARGLEADLSDCTERKPKKSPKDKLSIDDERPRQMWLVYGEFLLNPLAVMLYDHCLDRHVFK